MGVPSDPEGLRKGSGPNAQVGDGIPLDFATGFMDSDAVPDLSASVGELAGVLRTMFGLTRRNRLRDQIREMVGLLKEMDGYAALAGAATNVAAVIDLQSAQLLEAHQATKRKWNWPSFVVAEGLAALTTWAAWALWPLHHWYRTVLFVPDVVVGALMLIAGFGVLLAKADE